jgi:hypothetical protein
MRIHMLAFAVLLSACASAPRPTANIPAIRHQIDNAIAADPTLAHRTPDFAYDASAGTQSIDPTAKLPSTRKITAMGRVTPDRAIVYTRPGATPLEETWVRGGDGWTLAHVTELGNSSASASR